MHGPSALSVSAAADFMADVGEGEPCPGADVAGVSQVPGADVGRGEPCPGADVAAVAGAGADVAGVSQVPVQMWHEWAWRAQALAYQEHHA